MLIALIISLLFSSSAENIYLPEVEKVIKKDMEHSDERDALLLTLDHINSEQKKTAKLVKKERKIQVKNIENKVLDASTYDDFINRFLQIKNAEDTLVLNFRKQLLKSLPDELWQKTVADSVKIEKDFWKSFNKQKKSQDKHLNKLESIVKDLKKTNHSEEISVALFEFSTSAKTLTQETENLLENYFTKVRDRDSDIDVLAQDRARMNQIRTAYLKAHKNLYLTLSSKASAKEWNKLKSPLVKLLR